VVVIVSQPYPVPIARCCVFTVRYSLTQLHILATALLVLSLIPLQPEACQQKGNAGKLECRKASLTMCWEAAIPWVGPALGWSNQETDRASLASAPAG
jgi:hypothetical protein